MRHPQDMADRLVRYIAGLKQGGHLGDVPRRLLIRTLEDILGAEVV
jgi:hypothetical protein